jgi:hypothetical protein
MDYNSNELNDNIPAEARRGGRRWRQNSAAIRVVR